MHGVALFPHGFHQLRRDIVTAARSVDPLLEQRLLLSASDRQYTVALEAFHPSADANLVAVAAIYGHRDLRRESTRRTEVVVATQHVGIAHRASAAIVHDQIRIVVRLVARTHGQILITRRDVGIPNIVIGLAIELALRVRRPIGVSKESSVIGVAVEYRNRIGAEIIHGGS